METVYIDHGSMEEAIGIIFERDTKAVCTGLEVLTERDSPETAEISRLCGVEFFTQETDVPLYAVPYLEVFASDGRGGWFGTLGGGRGPIYYIAPDRTAHLLAEHRAAFFALITADPDWRCKKLPGGLWSRLPEDPDGRRKLAEAFAAPPPADTGSVPDAIPQVSTSRAEAEKEFAILDIWTVMRQKKTPRFQVHPMMSPQDREGRAWVHYQAWQEAYTGLMPESVLAAHTLERCQKFAHDRRFSNSGNTFVALDREDGDRVVGFATLSHHARDFVSVPEAGEVVALYVLQDFQGNGLGRELLEHCLAWLHRPRAALFVLEGNKKAIGFYEHMGFHLTGHRISQDGMMELEMVREK